MNQGPYGWTGKVLHIDLDTGTIRSEEPEEATYRRFIGGKGMAGHYLRPHCTRNWNDPEMPFLIFTGPLCATIAPTSGRACMMSRSPLTGAVGDSSVGGRLATELKRAGWDGIVIKGHAPALTGIEVRDGSVTLQNAGPLALADTTTVFDTLETNGPRGMSVACVGPAAENGSPMAAVMTDRHHAAGRCGLGASLAAKNIKYISIKGTGRVHVHNLQALKAAREEIFRLTAASPVLLGQNGFSCWGTGSIFDLMDSRRMMPTDNFSKTRFPDAPRLNAPAYKNRYAPKKHGCKGCHILCKKVAQDGRSMPEFETMSHFTALIGNTDMEQVLEANELLNRLGLDTISAGATLACLREIRGEDFDRDSLLGAIREMAEGGTLGSGSLAIAESAGHPEASMSVKGLEMAAYDPRGAYGMALAYAVSTRGACHLRAYPISHEILRKPVATDRFSFSGKARIVKIAEDVNAAVDSLIACKFIFLAAGLEEYAKAFTAVTGVPSTGHDLQSAGERIYYNERIMNALNGFSAADDDLPVRFFTEEGTSGGGIDVRPLNREDFLAARAAYYRIRGLDENGLPTGEKATELQLDMES